MKEPTHNIKLYSGNNIPCPDSTWYEIAPHWYQNSVHGWLGSGVKDKNGKEIFEGDIVQVETFKKDAATVEFCNGAFWLGNLILADLPVIYYPTLEIIGHIAEDEQ